MNVDLQRQMYVLWGKTECLKDANIACENACCANGIGLAFIDYFSSVLD